MEQFSLNFDTEPTSHKTPLVTKGVGERAERAMKKNSFIFQEEIRIGNTKCQFKVSSRLKEGSYTLDSENRRVTSLVFILTYNQEDYRFNIGISDYQLIDGTTEGGRYQDESMGDQIGTIHFSAIKKLDVHHGGPRFANRTGEDITSLDYFKYLFGGVSPHQALIPAIKTVILAILEKHREATSK